MKEYNEKYSDLLVETTSLRRTFTVDVNKDIYKEEITFPSIRIPRGGLIAIVGASGTGKTTLLNLLSGLDKPDSDAPEKPSICLRLGDSFIDVAEFQTAIDRTRIGFVFQQGHLLENASVAVNMAIPSLSQGNSVPRSKIESELSELLQLPVDFRTKKTWQLSGGQRQRIAVARAILHEPEVVFADEPTSSLDIKLAGDLIARVKSRWLNKQQRTTTILWVTHDLELASQYADQVLVLRTMEGGDYQTATLECVDNPKDEEKLNAWVYGLENFPGLLLHSRITSESTVTKEKGTSCQNDAIKKRPDRCRKCSYFSQHALESKLAFKLAVGEMFSRHHGIAKIPRNQGLGAWLAQTDSNKNNDEYSETIDVSRNGKGGFVPFIRSLYSSYNDYPSGLILGLSAILLTIAIFALQINNRIYAETLTSPLNCQVEVTGKIGDAGEPPNRSAIHDLANRPWLKAEKSTAQSKEFEVPEGFAYPLSSCAEGPAAFGRRDTRSWALGVVTNNTCVDSRFNAQILITEPNEPIFDAINLVDTNLNINIDTPSPLSKLLSHPGYFAENDIFISQKTYDNLKKFSALQELCLIKSWDESFNAPGNYYRVRIAGVVDAIPSSRRGGYDAFLADETFSQIAHHFDEPLNLFSNAIVYFNPKKINEVRSFFTSTGVKKTSIKVGTQSWFIEDDAVFERVEQTLRNANATRYFIVFLAFAIVLIVFLFLWNSALLFLDQNKKSLAVLLSFGVRDSLLSKLLAVRTILNFHMWLWLPLLLIPIVGTLFLWTGAEESGIMVDIPKLFIIALLISWAVIVGISLIVAAESVRRWRSGGQLISQLLN